jgi:hypothetical protein
MALGAGKMAKVFDAVVTSLPALQVRSPIHLAALISFSIYPYSNSYSCKHAI